MAHRNEFSTWAALPTEDTKRGASTWRKLIAECAGSDAIIGCTLTGRELDIPFNKSSFSLEGAAFTAWSHEYVYFPVTNAGREWVGRAPRNPCDTPTEHVGSE